MKSISPFILKFLSILFIGTLSPLLSAQAVDNHTQAQLVSEVTSIKPGVPFWVALELQMDSGWHTYHKEPGDSGFPTELVWDLPAGFEASDLQWPIPTQFKQDFLTSYGYEDHVLLMVKITPPETLAVGESVTLKGEASWLECLDICVPGSADVSLALPVSDAEPSMDANWHAAFQATRAKWPQADGPRFIETAELDHAAANTTEETNPTLGPKLVDNASTPHTIGLPYLLGLSLLGGLILNLMPCVFPVLGIKVMGFVNQAGKDSKKVVLHGLIFTLGVLISFWVLAGVFISLRLAGESVGWGFQMQDPIFVFALAMVFTLFGLNMSGLFEIGQTAVGVGSQLTGKSGLSGSFFSGILATLVSTPCSAPFLSTALSATSTVSTFQALLIFTFIALGLSSPYLILSAYPKALKYLPRPGAWMETLKQFLSFFLYGTVGYLIWILAGQVDADTFKWILFALVLTAMAAWAYGRWTGPTQASYIRYLVTAIALLLIGGSFTYIYQSLSLAKQRQALALQASSGEISQDFLIWETWSPEKVAQLQSEGKPIYIDFTARWCATCQVNKLNYKSEAVIDAFLSKGVTLLKADWTQADPRITEALAQYGRSSVPTNILYLPGQADPMILPEILTPGILLDALQQITTEAVE